MMAVPPHLPAPPDFLKAQFQVTRRAFLYIGIFSFFMNLLLLAMPMYTMQVYDRVLNSHSMETLVMLTLVTLGLFVALSAFNAIKSAVLTRIGEWMDLRLGPQLLEASIEKSAYENINIGNQNLRDIAVIKNFITGPGVATLFDAPWSALYIFVIILIDPLLGWIVFIGALILLFLAYLTEISTKKLLGRANRSSIRSMTIADFSTRNAEVIEAMGMMKDVMRHWDVHNRQSRDLQAIAGGRSNIIASISKFLRLSLQISITGTGAYLSLQGHISMGGIIAASILAGRALAPFEAAVSMWKSFLGARDSYQRINRSMAATIIPRGATRLPRPNGALTVEGVYYKPFKSDKFTLKNINFRLLPGESLGVIGPSAAGKSTLARLLVGVWPTSGGAVRLDAADVYKWARDDFGQYIGYLPQDVELFVGTVKENIARLKQNIQDEAVIEAAMLAGVHEMILQLPLGYETEISERGGLLSPGQKQRIGLARALFGDPRLLVLDEPNANLDSDGEIALLKALAKAREKGITTVVIAHRPSVVANMDKILMLRDGVAEAFGPREQVLAKYARPAALPKEKPEEPPKIAGEAGGEKS